MNFNNGRYEIGSHFWLEHTYFRKTKNDLLCFCNSEDSVFTFSGRSAINIALRDAMQTKKIIKAYLPSYCCSSMVQPFIENDISYDFYDVVFNNDEIVYHIDRNIKADIMLIMKYFGTKVEGYDSFISTMQKKGCIVIEDITHTLLDEEVNISGADYCAASLRKWFPVPAGGMVLKKKGKLQNRPSIVSDRFVRMKIEGMRDKFDYLSGNNEAKETYLCKFGLFENSLNMLDARLKIDNLSKNLLESTNLEFIKKKRKKNSSLLYKRLSGINGLKFLNKGFTLEKEVPLFVPIMLPTKKRNELRNYLIERKIYCPIHWPEVKGTNAGIRENELSLVCDQRYDARDMNYMADLIIDWCSRNFNVENCTTER